jgi:hypothetical protein
VRQEDVGAGKLVGVPPIGPCSTLEAFPAFFSTEPVELATTADRVFGSPRASYEQIIAKIWLMSSPTKSHFLGHPDRFPRKDAATTTTSNDTEPTLAEGLPEDCKSQGAKTSMMDEWRD